MEMPVTRRVCLLVFLLALASGGEEETDWSLQLEGARDLLAHGHPDEAYAEYVRYAERGNGVAQFTVGLFHRNGWDGVVDEAASVPWFARAAANGIPVAQHYFGEFLRDGKYLPADPAEAAKWFRASADGGHLLSLVALGDLHLEGRGVARDPDRALQLFEQAAERSVPAAQLRLAEVYLEGAQGIAPAPERAAHWLEAAAGGGSHEAEFRLGSLLLSRGKGPSAREGARTMFERAASAGYLPAYLPTAKLYLAVPEGERVAADHLAKAYLWLHAAARRLVDPGAKAEVAELLERVEGLVPETWRGDLDAKVKAHLDEVAASAASGS